MNKRIFINPDSILILVFGLLSVTSFAERTPLMRTDGSIVAHSVLYDLDTNYEACDIDAGEDKTICLGGSVTLETTVSSIVTYSWSPTTGLDDPSAANPVASPTATTTYTVTVDDGAGCIGSDQVIVQVHDVPTISLPATTVICDGEMSNVTATVSGANPFTFTWNGPATGATLTASPLSTTTYTVSVTDVNDCGNTAQVIVNVNSLPTVTLVLDDAQACSNEYGMTLTGGLPANGTYSGTHLSGNYFDVSAAGVGTHPVTYTYTDNNGCTNNAFQDVTVFDLPTVNLVLDDDSGCINGMTIPLSGGTPAGGTFSGNNVSGNSFDITTAWVGTHPITYTATDANGCTNSSTQNLEIYGLPNVALSLGDAQACADEASVTLSGGTPAGGTYSGSFVTGTTFDVTAAGVGLHTITYSYTDGNGCEGVATQDLEVLGLPTVTIDLDIAEVCNDVGTVIFNGGLPVGGSYSGPFVSGNSFDATAAGVGSHSVTYTYTDNNGCTNSASQDMVVLDLPIVNLVLDDDSGCINGTTIPLSGGTPAGGTFSGNNVSGSSFDITTAWVGTHPITYTVTDANGCTNSSTQNLEIYGLPNVALSLGDAQACADEASVTLSGGAPAGGTYSGSFVTGTTFDVTAAGVGLHTITYSYTNGNGCEGIATQDLEVLALPTVTFDLDIDEVCNDIGTVIFNGGFPAGGTYSGAFVSGNSFDVTAAGVGSHTITYTYIDGQGCQQTATDEMIVNALPVADAGDDAEFCLGASHTFTASGGVSYQWNDPNSTSVASVTVSPSATTNYTVTVTDSNGCTSTDDVQLVLQSTTVTFSEPNNYFCTGDEPYALSGGLPTGGSYSGLGVTAGEFDPMTAGVGTHALTYTYTDDCTYTADFYVTVAQSPTTTLSLVDDIACANQPGVTLAGGIPAGGQYSGLGVTGNYIDVQVAGVGVHEITYLYTDPTNGCTATATQDFTITELPVVELVLVNDEGCYNDTTLELDGGTPAGGVYSGVGVTGTNFNPSQAWPGIVTIGYTYTDANGCEATAYAGLQVHNIPSVNLDIQPKQFCVNGPAVMLSNGQPTGGTFSGAGVVTGEFDPSVAGLGTHTISYVYTDANGCEGTATDQIEVVNPQSVTLNLPQTEVCEDVFGFNLSGGLPQGGTYSGTGVSGTYFDVTVAGVGTHTITYTQVDPNTGCENMATQDVTVIELPDVEFNLSQNTACFNDDPFVLSGGTPLGGTYSGPGVSGTTFDPSMAFPGTVFIAYTYEDPTTGCSNNEISSIEVYAVSQPTLNLTSSVVCVTETSTVLSGGSPAGGTYSGPGVTAGIFDATSVGIGTYPITYTVTDANGCIGEVIQNIQVSDPAAATLNLGQPIVCSNEIGITLTGGSPAGGTYSGTGVSGDYFDVAVAGVGLHTITYNVVDPSTGCEGSATQDIEVVAAPIVTLDIPEEHDCIYNSTLTLTGESPAGGVWSGAGVSGNNFNGAWAGVGTHTIYYTYSNATGCTVAATDEITVHARPDVFISLTDNTACINETSHLLAGGQPAGGVYSGTGVSGTTFNASLAGLGTHLITYTVVDAFGCDNYATQEIFVVEPPVVNINMNDVNFCFGEDNIALNASPSGSGGTWSGQGVVGGLFNTTSSGVGTFTLTYTYIDANGCEDSATQDVIVHDIPTVTLELIQDEACVTGNNFQLSGATPDGGWYTGSGVSGTNFDPASAGVGDHTITYHYTDANGCTNTSTDILTVLPEPTVQVDLSDDEVCAYETITLSDAQPAGGVWSGPGVTGDQFDASVAGIGTHTITYTYELANCTVSNTDDLVVYATPIIALNLPITEVCEGEFISLSATTPSGGMWSGPGIVSGQMNTAISGPGTHTISYTYVDANGCEATESEDILVYPETDVTLGLPSADVCINDPVLVLSGGSPAGGTYSGPGISGNTFDPAVATVGLHTITYSYTDANGCEYTASENLRVEELPDIRLELVFDDACLEDEPEILRGGSPLGGVWSGPGVSGNMIDPAIAGVGVHTITYTIIGNNGCEASVTDTYEVYPAGTADLVLVEDEFCIGESGIVLAGGSPAGGLYRGPGVDVTTGTLNTVLAGTGTHTIEYLYRDGNGCGGTATDEITIYDVPAVTFNLSEELFCSTVPAFALSGGSPAGGTYSGPGVTGGSFDPQLAGAGVHTITYTYIDANGCQSEDTEEIVVELPAEVTYTIEDDHCGLNIGAINFEFLDVSGVSLIQFSINGGITWSSDIDDDDTGSTSFNSLSSGDYELLVRNASGACELNLGTVTIQNISAPSADAGSDHSIVPPGTAQLSGSGGISFSWSPTTGLDNPNSANPIASPQETTTYILEVTDEYGCKATDEVVVNVIAPCGGILSEGDYPYTESFESGFGLWTQEIIEDDFDWIIENGAPGPGSASNGNFFVYAGCTGCSGQMGATAVTASTSVNGAANALDLPDGAFARLYQANSSISLDLGSLLPAGTDIFITWRRKTSYSPGPFADMIVDQSANGTNWIEHSIRPSTSSQNFITTTLTLETATRYVRLAPETGSNDDFDLDAVISVSGSSDLTTILKSPCFNLVDESCAQATFDFNMNGQSSGEFRLEASTDFGQTWSELGVYVADGSSVWTTEVVDMFGFIDEINVQIRFVAELDGSTGYAIDNFEFITTGCGCDDTSSPFESFNLVPDPQPFSVDIDCDGDADMLAGGDGELFFFENNGDGTYTDRTGTAQDIMPTLSFLDMTIGLVDLDDDGDLDLSIVGNEPFNKYFFWNTGSKTNPIFTPAGTGGTPANPISGFDLNALDGSIWVGYADATIFWADLDRDGDFDAVVGGKLGWFHYYENQGSETSPNLVRQVGANNPFNGLRADGADEGNGIIQYESAPFLTDWDGDGDLDMFSGNQIATVQYFENIGTATNPVFVEVVGDDNPFDGVIFSEDSHLSIVDEDCDNDWDVFYGVGDTPNDAEATLCDLLVAVPNIAIANSSQNHYCVGETIFLFEQSQSGVSWLWTGPNGFMSTEQNPTIPNITEANAGTYYVDVANDQGCEFMSSIEITVSEALADAGPDFCIELGETTQLQGSGQGVVFLWTPATGLSNPNILNPFSSPTQTTNYTLTVTDEFGCTATDDMVVVVKSPECVYGDEIFYSDFETTTGDNFWSIVNGANDGNFVIGVPNPYGTLGVQMELPAQEGDNVLLTGDGYIQDLDGFAATSASSRDIVLPSDAISLNISLYWYFSHFSNSSAADYLTLEIRNAANDAVLLNLIDENGSATERPASWSFLTADLSAFIGQTIYIYAESRDAAGGSKLEVAIDEVIITGVYSTVATLTLPNIDICENLEPIELSGGEPAGGIYTGVGVSDSGFFDPEVAGVGTHTIYYEYSENEGCTATASAAIVVIEVPDVSVDLAVGEACVNETSVGLFGGSPTGGTYSGPGVTGNTIDPSAIGVGLHTITYTIIDDNGCENSTTDEFEVLPTPEIISVDSEGAVCDNGNGTITIEFDPTASPMGAEVSIDGGLTWVAVDAAANGVYVFMDVLPGDYNVWVRNTDSTCPIEIEDVTIINEPGPAVSIGEDLKICGTGGMSLNVVAETEFGTEPLTIEWEGPSGFTATGSDIDIENPGLYSVLVTDANNCVAADTMELSLFSITTLATIEDETCYGFRNGSITIVASGAEPISYNLVGEEINNTGQFDNLPSGHYQVIIEDANGCILTEEYTVAGPVELVCTPDSCVRNITQEWSGTGPYSAGLGMTNVSLTTSSEAGGNVSGVNFGQTLTANSSSQTAGYVVGQFDLSNARRSFAGPQNLFDGVDNVHVRTFHARRLINNQDWGIAYRLGGLFEIENIAVDLRNDCCRRRGLGGVMQVLRNGTIVYQSNELTGAGNGVISATPLPQVLGDEVRYIFLDGKNTEGGRTLNFAEWIIQISDSLVDDEWYSEMAINNPSMAMEIVWDNSPEVTSTDIDLASDDKATTDLTFDFAEPVSHMVLHVDRLGELVDGFSNSSIWTVTTPGVSLQKVSGTSDLQVTATTFYKSPDINTISSQEESSYQAVSGAAAGSISIISATPLTSLSFAVTGVGVEGNGSDFVELALSGTVCYPTMVQDFGCGEAQGMATISALGGTPPYTFLWDNMETTQTATSLEVGVHMVTITDNNDCEVVCSVEIEQEELEVEAGNNISFCEGESGTLAPTITADATPYEIAWAGPGGFVSDVETPTVTEMGTYTLTVTDDNGCTASDVVDVFTFVCDTESECYYLHNFNTSLSYFGSEGALSWADFSWDETGDNNSSNSGNIMIFNNALLMENTGSATTSIQRRLDLTGHSSAILSLDIVGEGVLDAGDEFIIEVYDGTSWTTLYTHNGPIIGLMPGFDISAYISANTEIRITIVSGFEDFGERLFIDNVRVDLDCLCDGNADAGPDIELCEGEEVELTASGGVAYEWSPETGLSDPNVANPMASPTETTVYSVTVTDINGCPDVDEIMVTVLTAPEVTEVTTEEATCGENNGEVTICIEGLLPSEEAEVSLDNGTTWEAPITHCGTYGNLAPGNYNLIVRKTGGDCPVTVPEFTIEDTPVVSVDLGLALEICPEDQGTITANPTNGALPLTYAWAGPGGFMANTQEIVVSDEGIYSVTVTDANDCTAEDFVGVDVLEVESGSIELTNLLCPENDPDLILSASEPSICNHIVNSEANQGLDGWTIINGSGITPPATLAIDDTGLLSGNNSVFVDITNTNGTPEDIVVELSGITLEAGETYTISFDAAAQINRPIEVLLQLNGIPFDTYWLENVNLTTMGDTYTFTFTATENVIDARLLFNLGISNASVWLDNVVVKKQDCVEPSFDYTWECRDSDGAGGWTVWTTVPGATGESFDPPVLTNTRQYRRLAAAQGCLTFTASNIIEIELCPCELEAGAEETICQGESVVLMPVATGFGTLTYLWSPSSSLSSPVAPTPIASPLVTTNYSVTVTDQNGCETIGEVLVTVLNVPVTTVSSADASCDMDNGMITISFEDLPNTDQIQFSLDGGTTWETAVSDSDGTVTYEDLPIGFYDLWIRLADGTCPVDIDDVTIEEKPAMTLELGEDQTLCVGETAQFAPTLTNGTAPFTYEWEGPNGFTSDANVVSVTEEGSYTLVVTDADGCEVTDVVTLHLLDLEPGTIAAPTMTCPENDPSIISSVTDPSACDAPGCIEPTYEYLWECRESDGTGGWTAWTVIAGATSSTYDPPVQMATKQYRRLVSAAGCDDYYASNEVEVEICPCEITVGEDQEVCIGESIMLTAAATGVGEISYEWSPAATLDDPSSATPMATPEGTTTYTVTATDALGCMVSDQVTLTQMDSTEVWCEQYSIRDEDGNWSDWIPMDDCTIELCEMNGQQDIRFDGGPDINEGWVWTDEAGNVSGGTTERIIFIDIGMDDAGSYTGTLTNENGCVSVVVFNVVVNPSVDAEVTGVVHDHCLDSSGATTITISEGQAPFTINWQNEDGGEAGSTTITEPGDYTIPGLNGGTTYCIGVEDANGCQLNP